MRLTGVIQQPDTAAEARAMVGTKRKMVQTVAIGRVDDSRSKCRRLMVEGEEAEQFEHGSEYLSALTPSPVLMSVHALVFAPAAPAAADMWNSISAGGPFRSSPAPLASPARPPAMQRLTVSTVGPVPYRGRPHSACFGDATNTSAQTTQAGGLATASSRSPVSLQVSQAVAAGAGAEPACPSTFETDVVRPGIFIVRRPLAIRPQERSQRAAGLALAAPILAATLAATTTDSLQQSQPSAFVASARTAYFFSIAPRSSAAIQVTTAALRVAADLFEPRPNIIRRLGSA